MDTRKVVKERIKNSKGKGEEKKKKKEKMPNNFIGMKWLEERDLAVFLTRMKKKGGRKGWGYTIRRGLGIVVLSEKDWNWVVKNVEVLSGQKRQCEKDEIAREKRLGRDYKSSKRKSNRIAKRDSEE